MTQIGPIFRNSTRAFIDQQHRLINGDGTNVQSPQPATLDSGKAATILLDPRANPLLRPATGQILAKDLGKEIDGKEHGSRKEGGQQKWHRRCLRLRGPMWEVLKGVLEKRPGKVPGPRANLS